MSAIGVVTRSARIVPIVAAREAVAARLAKATTDTRKVGSAVDAIAFGSPDAPTRGAGQELLAGTVLL